jgi:hypothetical protein
MRCLISIVRGQVYLYTSIPLYLYTSIPLYLYASMPLCPYCLLSPAYCLLPTALLNLDPLYHTHHLSPSHPTSLSLPLSPYLSGIVDGMTLIDLGCGWGKCIVYSVRFYCLCVAYCVLSARCCVLYNPPPTHITLYIYNKYLLNPPIKHTHTHTYTHTHTHYTHTHTHINTHIGSVTLYMAQRFPNCKITSISNSNSQVWQTPIHPYIYTHIPIPIYTPEYINYTYLTLFLTLTLTLTLNPTANLTIEGVYHLHCEGKGV